MDVELLRANLVRTLVPIIVGALVSLLPVLNGPDFKGHEEVAAMVGFAVSAVYYSAFRIAETRYPQLGLFLGKRMVQGAPAENTSGQVPSAGSSAAVDSAGSINDGHLSANGVSAAEVHVRATDSDSMAVVSVGGHRVAGVMSVAWSPHPDGSTLLTLRLRDAGVTITTSTETLAHDLTPPEGLNTLQMD